MSKEKIFALLAIAFVLAVVVGLPLILPIWFRWVFGVLPDSSPEQLGQFGDMYGIANSLFSGLAFVGLICAILLQRKDLQLQKEELSLTRDELKRSAEAAAVSAEIAAIGALLELLRTRRARLLSVEQLESVGHAQMTELTDRIHKLESKLDAHFNVLMK